MRAQVIQVTPRISAPIVNLTVEDHQFVKAGDVLFETDPRTFRPAVDGAKTDLQQAHLLRHGVRRDASEMFGVWRNARVRGEEGADPTAVS